MISLGTKVGSEICRALNPCSILGITNWFFVSLKIVNTFHTTLFMTKSFRNASNAFDSEFFLTFSLFLLQNREKQSIFIQKYFESKFLYSFLKNFSEGKEAIQCWYFVPFPSFSSVTLCCTLVSVVYDTNNLCHRREVVRRKWIAILLQTRSVFFRTIQKLSETD